ncbi:MAG: hypothetical protein LBD31_09895 [Treponema sp.]|nr:hypothetical protein [Treponema sp.]
MKTIQSGAGLFLLVSLFFCGCDQEPLFWNISQEVVPIKPVIEGAPSRIVKVGDILNQPVLYVTNGTVWEYNLNSPEGGKPVWKKMRIQPGGNTKTLAAADSYLFALNMEGTVRRWNGSVWEEIDGGGSRPQQIFGAGTALFAGAPRDGGGYRILNMDTSTGNALTHMGDTEGLLMGAAWDGSYCYLGTTKDGIYKITLPATSLPGPVDPGSEGIIAGLLAYNDETGQTRVGAIRADSNGGCDFLSYELGAREYTQSLGSHFSGAMAYWKHSDGSIRLLLGRHNGGYEEYDPGARMLVTPGETASFTVERDSRYTSTIGKYPVISLYCAPQPDPSISNLPAYNNGYNPDGRPIIFASTGMNGLWSYRYRKTGGSFSYWNGEDNGN